MRHGRKSRSVLSGGYKRHVMRDLDTGMVPAVGITPANAPEASVTGDIEADLQAAGRELAELHIDRAYLSSALVRDRSPDLAIYCKAWAGPQHQRPVHQGPVQPRLRYRPADLPGRSSHAVRARQDGALPRRHLHGLPPAGSLHHQQQRPQRRHPPRCGAAGRAAPPPAGPGRAREAAGTRRGRACLAHVGRWQGRRAATGAPARTCPAFAASPWSTTSTSSPASPPPTVTSYSELGITGT